jgi:hypothetical protein
MSSHPTSKKKRKARQRLRERYMKVREDCQLEGIIETTPEGALCNEVAPVAPDPPLPHLVREAIKNNWPTPDCNKPGIVDSLCAAVHDRDANAALRIECFKVLFLLDKLQYDIDHPE